MYGVKIKRDMAGREYSTCSKCHNEATEFIGIKVKEATEHTPGRLKWVCKSCYASYIAGDWSLKLKRS